MKYFIDYRFIVEAKSMNEAANKIMEFLPEAKEDITYAISRSIQPQYRKAR